MAARPPPWPRPVAGSGATASAIHAALVAATAATAASTARQRAAERRLAGGARRRLRVPTRRGKAARKAVVDLQLLLGMVSGGAELVQVASDTAVEIVGRGIDSVAEAAADRVVGGLESAEAVTDKAAEIVTNSVDVAEAATKKAAKLAEEGLNAAEVAGVKAAEKVGKGLDTVAKVDVDANTEDEYWSFGILPLLGPLRILRKRTTDSEVALVGLFAGGAIELGRVLLLHPFDTVKTRLQTPGAGTSALRPERLLDGLGPAVATVPLCALFWAVKDVVRRRILGFEPPFMSVDLWRDVFATTLAAAAGEAAYWAARTPGELLKTREQAALVEVEEKPKAAEGEAEEAAEAVTAEGEAAEAAAAGKTLPQETEDPLWLESLLSFPVLALSDIPNVSMRTGFFVLLHTAPGAPTGVGADALLFTIASTGAALLSTPLDVARTRLLLSGGGVGQLPETLASIGQEEGISGLMAGWLPRTVWNGLALGVVLGLVRQEYSEVRARFLLDVLDQVEGLAMPILNAAPHSPA